ncbi:MAG: ABC transporter ATP-binding protein [Candidatus Hodarchaeales archaeon]|jgi:energy-coupling factor transporter ATP-binding protein EcfA2
MLEITHLKVKYAGSSDWALDNISMIAKPSQITLITGSSGSGKSTLARALMTLIPKFFSATMKGKIQVNDRLIQSYPRSELIKLCGYVPQYPADFVTTLSVEEEVALILENLGFITEEIISRLDEVFTMLEINHLRNKLQTELSSGELQRIAIATALAPNVPILILDEPMARIDLKSELLLVSLLKKIAENGKTVIAFEHRLDYLLEVADNVIILEKGQIKAQGKPETIIKDLLIIDPPEISLMKIPNSSKIPASFTDAHTSLKEFLL